MAYRKYQREPRMTREYSTSERLATRILANLKSAQEQKSEFAHPRLREYIPSHRGLEQHYRRFTFHSRIAAA